MWIIRFGTLKPKDYNTLSRLFLRSGFKTRSIAPIVYAKALILYTLQNRSLRSLASEFGVSHIGLHSFFVHIKNTPEYGKIFHVFLKSRSTLYVENTRAFSRNDLENSDEIYALTKLKLESILQE